MGWIIRSAAAACLWSVAGSSPADRPVKDGGRPAVAPDPIAEALCGRRSSQSAWAEALEHPGPDGLPEIWRKAKISDLDIWLAAPRCLRAKVGEANLFKRRSEALEGIRVRIERARGTERFEDLLAQVRAWPRRPGPVPLFSECPGCDSLDTAAVAALAIAAQWPRRQPAAEDRLGLFLAAAEKREALMAELCRAKPSPRAREEIRRSFLYYTWTADGAWLFAAAAWFDRPEVAVECHPR